MGATPQEGRKLRTFRLVLRCCVLAAAVVLVLDLLPWPWAPMILPAASPFVMICSAIALRSLGVATLVGLPVLVLVLLRRRWFCRNACPVGLISEQTARLRPPGGLKPSRFPPAGQWIALLTLAGACLGYPLLLWMDPLALFCGFFSGDWRGPWTVAALVPAVGLPVVLIVNLVSPKLWCLRICPLGATQELLALPIRTRGGENPPQREPAADNGRKLLRRSVLALGLGGVWAMATLRAPRRRQTMPIRPPGAIDEPHFGSVCLRCGNCARACPEGVIWADLGDHGIAAFLTPVVHFEDGYCREDCRRCTQVCPSGAIARLSLEEKRTTPMGLAEVDMSLCLLADDKECDVCVSACPYEAVKIKFDWEDYSSTPTVDPEKCPGCGACQAACPAAPTKAIVVAAGRSA